MIEAFLGRVEPFTRLNAVERRRLAQVAKERSYGKGQTIFRAGQSSDAVWIVKTGRVHLMKFLADGKASTTCVMAPGETFCCLPALDRKTYPTDAIAAQDSVVVRIPSDAFHQAMEHSPVFTQQTLCLFCDRLRQVEHKSCMVYDSAETRLAQVLLALSKKFGLTIPLTRQELAEVAGTTHETAIRTLSRFGKQGLIRSSRGNTTILKPDKLSSLLTTCE
ncbi:MAG: Crp/Fnr family transcriptional regulator [Candidatus Omnitrophica bacterium]|nr:Crp/Fnr family transcriptional regulator [Candidatus Omnitrophota bacterium]